MRQVALRPGDVALALELALRPEEGFVPLARAAGVSLGEAHKGVGRLRAARLLAPDARRILPGPLLDFIAQGVPYAFPPLLGPVTRGIPTAHAAPPLAGEFATAAPIVWPSAEGRVRGESLAPLYPAAPTVARQTPDLYELLALVDAVRVGRARERQSALQHLRSRLSQAP